MLPGFRLLFAATLLTVSLLVFGLGAAALLRASHDRVASLPKPSAPAPVLTQTADTAPPTLSLLRVEPPMVDTRPVNEPAAPQFDTLLPTDRIATLSIAPRMDEAITALPLAVEMKPDASAEIKAEPPKVEPTLEIKADVKAEPKIEIVPEPTPQIVAPPAVPPIEAVAAPIPLPAAAEPVVVAKADEPLKVEAVASPESALPQVAALPEPEITGAIKADVPQEISEPPLVNAKPIRRPPVPRGRPAEADVVAALPDAAVDTVPAVTEEKTAVRRRRPVVKRAAQPKRRTVINRPAPQRPARPAPNTASPFGTTPFGT